MPYVPSKKTDGKSTDREVIDAALEPLAQSVAEDITNNFSLRPIYEQTFIRVAYDLRDILKSPSVVGNGLTWDLAKAIYETGAKYGYEGVYLGEFNYAFTRFIQRVPQIKVKRGDWKDELRYWLYAETVTALCHAEKETEHLEIGVDGVFRDIKDEYKRRMNTAYEAAQIVKSGDCYDGPYYTRLVEVVDEEGRLIGHMEVMLKRSQDTLHKDVLDRQLVLKSKNPYTP
ncbi:hypothetical protein A2833_03135 [Candidatus Azambacteria bacterium RIFCSPHIGHO2_01_FULL_44_55]|uniref:Uncharacterized protein n=1 Tax=Candidatus Azambacteria bacterium RIFCSPLOWO2_02_FULL_44_14 TaxID=1797306 RepID=A0A1F5CBI3_9BACT|nr:MAG: hypothetical protein A3A18_02450 [Candidatus Azambacteria bacterium RIFCSPLOWO2_01_FULL_44_84]OGD32725.1 MAG: hypothetical protein A3C78_01865 [Candidatus Azambacteria bacterium RIFCSPHIGHO2_02_FULL_45_18]OGD40178.1 MAG: hypothetical protein A3I30_02830 [Candidatus Azambacteria bacterium RIFCSPLOWO2_02_FULL_44_14]OGD41710.1 MAG: hypothetical protein A2833_03135 [Candidatus Azambacteria bacterium RIFCSPHIGHO2_01_FULL_44_55]OGD50071.1 MAG: hypothetical protein A2608_03420 [Candidatus Azam